MAKADKQEQQQNDERVEVPSHLRMDPKVFEQAAGDTFGGSSEILVLDEGEAAGPLTYVGHRLTDLGNKLAPADIHEAKDAEGATWRLPIATNFRRQAEGANLQRGDTFALMRLPDAVKKNGIGAGGKMQMYQVKVLARAATAATAAV